MRAAPPEQDHGYDTALDDPPCDTIEPGDLLDDPRTDAEALCLCSLLWSSPAVARTIVGALTGSDFERPVYGELFTVIAEQVQTNTPHDPASIAAALTQAGKSAGHRGTDVANFWFEVGPIPNPKDAIENTLNHATCHDLIPLATAQTAITHH